MKGLARVLTGVAAVAVCLGVLELGLRFKHGALSLAQSIHHPHFHHRYPPYAETHFKSAEFDVEVKRNRFGLRGPEPIVPKPAGTTRLLMLGDSFTAGFAVRDGERFCDLIEQGLKARGFSIEVVNGGVSGYSPTLEYLSLRDQYLTFEPDAVILWLDLGDLQEDYWFQKNLIYDAQGRILRCDPMYTNGRFDHWEWLKQRSALAQYVDAKILRTFSRIQVLGLKGFVEAKLHGERAKVAVARLKAMQRTSDLPAFDRFLLVRETSTEVFLKPYWALTAKYLRMIHELLEERDIPFVLGVYPYGMLVGPDQWTEGRVFWGFERGKTYDANAALALVTHFVEEERIPLINAFDSFRASGKTQKLFFDQDGHFNPSGHRVLAEHALNDPTFLVTVQHAIRRAQRAHSRRIQQARATTPR